MSAQDARIFRCLAALAFVLSVLPGLGAGEGAKLKVTIDNSAIYTGPSSSTPKVANVPLNKVLDSTGRQGHFYKVTLDQNGVKINGYVHQEVVEEITEKEAEELAKRTPGPAEAIRTQAEIEVRLDDRIADNKALIKEGRDYARAVENLRAVIAEVFGLEDRQKQKKFACNVYYWLGVALAKSGDSYGATGEFRNMFEVDTGFAAEVTNDLFDTGVSRLVELAKKQQQGLITSYTLSINTEPQGATVSVDGKVIGKSPQSYSTTTPKFTLEFEKEGYAPLKKTVFMMEASASENVPLQSIGRNVRVGSTPSGARVYLDGRDTGLVTECELPYVSFGEHTLKLTKDDYADWEGACQVPEGAGPLPVTSVLTVSRYAAFRKWGGVNSKSFKLPKAVASDASGNIYVADESDLKVRKYDPELRSMPWSDPGLTIRKLDVPAGLALDGQGFLYVTDSANSCVVKFDRNGKQVAKWVNKGVRGGDLNGPAGIAVDRNDDVYVADSGNNRVVKYSSAGAVKKTWGKQGSGPGDFVLPTAVAVTPKNEIIVADKGCRVQKFTPEGVYISEFGKSGSGEGELNRPLGLCTDADGYVYVADTGNHRVLKFTPDGKLVAKVGGGAGASGGPLTGPVSVAVTGKGSVFVAEKDIHQIQEFRVPAR